MWFQNFVIMDIYNFLSAECDGANEKAKSQLASLSQLQQAARDSEIELDSCQTQATQCQSTLSGVQTEMWVMCVEWVCVNDVCGVGMCGVSDVNVCGDMHTCIIL